MSLENPLALRFIFQGDLYFTNADEAAYHKESSYTTVAETPKIELNYKGSNQSRFLILVYYPNLEFIDELHFTALQSILRGLQLDADEAAIVNKANYPSITFAELAGFFEPRKMLILGNLSLPSDMENSVPNKPFKLNNCNALYSFSFDEMMNNTLNKKTFWEQIKKL